jgi:Kef-type K+ transport system membrane component KefB
MELWKRQYGTVWLAFFSCILIPRWLGSTIGLPIHALLGLTVLLLTQGNRKRLEALPVPDRLKRISRVMAGLAVFQLIVGMSLGAVLHLAPTLSLISSALRVVHVICALAILAQASSVATAYDMWEDKEFATTSEGKRQANN